MNKTRHTVMTTQKNSRDRNQAVAPQELSLTKMATKLREANPVVKYLEEELKPFKESLAKIATNLHEAKTVVKHLEEELNPVIESLDEMEAFYKVSLHKSGLAGMEEFYKEKLQQERFAHKETEEELKSFKDRVAGEVDLALKTGNSENMNNPVNETRLKEMYKELRKDWAKIKPFVQSPNNDPVKIKAYIKDNFQHGAGEMEQKKKQIESVFGLKADNTRASQKVHEYTKLTIQNFQLAFYYSFKDTAAQGFHGREGETLDYDFKNLLSKCHWLSGLLALNDPPLQPDWINHQPGQDAWNLFPQDIGAVSAM